MKKDKERLTAISDEEDIKKMMAKSQEIVAWLVNYASSQVDQLGSNDPNYYMLTALNLWFTLQIDISYSLKEIFKNFNTEYAKELKKQKQPKYGG
jgi:hypothetical protein